MPTKTTVKTKVMTNTHLAVATIATIFAGGMALAAVPSAPQAPAQSWTLQNPAELVESITLRNQCVTNTRQPGYAMADLTCMGGTSRSRSVGCNTVTTTVQSAQNFCGQRVHIEGEGENRRVVYLTDIAFASQKPVVFFNAQIPGENEVVPAVKVKYSNVGPVSFVAQTYIRLTYLDYQGQPILSDFGNYGIRMYDLSSGETAEHVEELGSLGNAGNVADLISNGTIQSVRAEFYDYNGGENVGNTFSKLDYNHANDVVTVPVILPLPILPMPEQYNDLYVQNVKFTNDPSFPVRIVVGNKGRNSSSNPLQQNGIEVKFKDRNNRVFATVSQGLESIVTGANTEYAFAFPATSTLPTSLEVNVDPLRQGGETQARQANNTKIFTVPVR